MELFRGGSIQSMNILHSDILPLLRTRAITWLGSAFRGQRVHELQATAHHPVCPIQQCHFPHPPPPGSAAATSPLLLPFSPKGTYCHLSHHTIAHFRIKVASPTAGFHTVDTFLPKQLACKYLLQGVICLVVAGYLIPCLNLRLQT